MNVPQKPALNRLYRLNDSLIFEVVRAMGLPQTRLNQGLIRLLFGRATLRFAELAIEFDSQIERYGAMEGSNWLLRHFVHSHEARGTQVIPKDGPLIIAANHPASYDGLLISAYVPRKDYKIIIGDTPPYQYLPNIRKHAIFSANIRNTFERMGTVRNAIKHLRSGGSLLIFPRGNIEPDPSFMPDPDSEFDRWSRSLDIFVRSVPETQVLVTIVGGVISPKTYNHPFTWFRKFRADKQRLAFFYQIIRQVLSGRELFGLTARVTFGELLHKPSLKEVEQAANRTMARHLSFVHAPN